MAVRKLDLMHRMFGPCAGHTCGECSNLVSGKYHDRTYRKCKVYGLTHSEASDWAKRWTACGMFNIKYSGNPIIQLVRPSRAEKELINERPLENQISIWEAENET